MLKSKIIKVKNRLFVVEPYLDVWYAKFHFDISIFDKHIAQKPNQLMSFFKLQFWAFLDFAQKKRHFWNPENKLVQKHIFCIRKYPLENSSLCDPRLTWPFSVVDLHGVRLQNGFDFWILRAKVIINHVPHARRRVLFGWLFVTFRDLTLTPTRT